MGNAWFYGSDGCFVITNFHVAFGQTKKSVRIEPTGKVINRVVLVDNPRSGHEVRFGYDFNAATGDFVRAAIGTVVAFGIYEEGSIAGMREDVAVLRLEKCGMPRCWR